MDDKRIIKPVSSEDNIRVSTIPPHPIPTSIDSGIADDNTDAQNLSTHVPVSPRKDKKH